MRQFALRDKTCSEREFAEWLQSIGGWCATQPLPVYDKTGSIKYYRSHSVSTKDGITVQEEN